MKLHFEKWGPAIPAQNSDEKNRIEKVLLLHGLGGTGSLWRPIAATLEENFAILAPDQRGHGKSRTNGSYSPLDFGKDLEETLREADFHPAWVVGHSMGVRSACALAHLRPDYVEGLILVDLGLVGAAGGGLHQNLYSFLSVLPESFPSRELARKFMKENCPDPSIGQYLMAVSVRENNGTVSFPFDAKSLLRALEEAREVDLRPWVREFAAPGRPVLLLRGALSSVWSHSDFERARAEFRDLPSVRFHEITGTGHGLPFEKRKDFTQELLTEISRRPPSR